MRPIPPSVRQRLKQLPPNAPIRIYTLQHRNVWDNLVPNGLLHGDHGHIDEEDIRPYNWMRASMQKRMPNHSGHLPIWAVLKPNSKHHYVPYNSPMVEIGAVVPLHRILASDFSLYHMVMNNAPILNEWMEHDNFTCTKAEKEQSWDTIFDLSPRVGVDATHWGQADIIQLCVDTIKHNEIFVVRSIPSRTHRTPNTCLYYNNNIQLPPPIYLYNSSKKT